MSLDDFERAFVAENDYVERKTGIGQLPISRAMTAFSNTDGGVILVGVKDDGTIVGRALSAGVENSIHDVALTIHDPGRYRIRELAVDGKFVVAISVSRREQGFAQTSDGLVLVRRGARSVPLIGGELLSFVTSRALVRFDESDSSVPLTEASLELLDEVRRSFKWRSATLTERLIEQRYATRAEPPNLTIAGALLLLSDPASELGKAYVEVLRYPDADSVTYDRREEFGGPAQAQVAASTQFILDELGTDLIVSGLRRYDLPKIPEVVLREALANAVAHRTYEDLGRAVRVELRPDDVSIVSPGGLPEPVTVENMRETQSARNIVLIKALRNLQLAEDAGRGVDVMQDSMAEALLDPPIFEDLGHSVRVTLPIRGPISPQERAWIFEIEDRGQITSRDRIPLIHAARGEQLTNAMVRSFLGVDSHEARQSLHRLRDSGFLQQIGMRGGASYILAESIRAPAAFRMSPSALEDFVTELAHQAGRINNAAVREATGLTRTEALRLLERLVDSGRLRRRGERRGAYYMPR